MRTPIALLAGAALLAPALLVAQPASAAPKKGATVTNCVMTKHGVKVRIKIRDEGRAGMNVRVSHRDAAGNFREPRVSATQTWIYRESEWVPPDRRGREIGSAATLESAGSAYSFRTGPREYITIIGTTFTLRSGKKIKLACRAH
ncbi:hypothetical protein [Sporichthya brevicatena]